MVMGAPTGGSKIAPWKQQSAKMQDAFCVKLFADPQPEWVCNHFAYYLTSYLYYTKKNETFPLGVALACDTCVQTLLRFKIKFF
jgi:hypothetical protein